mmetsp:Transcript_65612/g.125131  ORF Transcript_65612/g.125131 Transcript_65612/m.125131 type:complete len:531 (-) Transcript_65612:34-1626(-)
MELRILAILVVTVRANTPFRPSPIIDPTGELDCTRVESCAKDRDCEAFPNRICGAGACPKPVCLHKAAFPLLPTDVATLVTLFFVAAAAGAAGIGGGGLNVPLLMVLDDFTMKEAVPLSHVAVMGNAIAQVIFNVRARHPASPYRPLIHYEFAFLMLPAQLTGSSMGVVIGRVMPPSLLIVLALGLLALATAKSLRKGWVMVRNSRQVPESNVSETPASPKEKHASPEGNSQREFLQESLPPVLPLSRSSPGVLREALPCPDAQNVQAGYSGVSRTLSGTVLPVGGRNIGLLALPDSRSPVAAQSLPPMRIPKTIIAYMVAFSIVYCLDFILMSKDVFGTVRCSPIYWVALFGLYPFAAASIFLGVKHVKRLAHWHEMRGDPPLEGDPPLTVATAIVLPSTAVVIGLLAGLLGLGGGEFLVPILLEFGVAPHVSSATSGLLIFLSTSSDIIHYFCAGTLEPTMGYAIFLFVLNMAGATVGLQLVKTSFVQKRSYLIVFLVAALLLVGAVLLLNRGILQSDLQWSFQSLCA